MLDDIQLCPPQQGGRLDIHRTIHVLLGITLYYLLGTWFFYQLKNGDLLKHNTKFSYFSNLS